MGMLEGLFGSKGGGGEGGAGDVLGGAASTEPTVGGEAAKMEKLESVAALFLRQ